MISWRSQFIFSICPTQLAFLWLILFRSALFSPICSRTSSLVIFSDHFTVSIFFQHQILKLFKYFGPIIFLVAVENILPSSLLIWCLPMSPSDIGCTTTGPPRNSPTSSSDSPLFFFFFSSLFFSSGFSFFTATLFFFSSAALLCLFSGLYL